MIVRFPYSLETLIQRWMGAEVPLLIEISIFRPSMTSSSCLSGSIGGQLTIEPFQDSGQENDAAIHTMTTAIEFRTDVMVPLYIMGAGSGIETTNTKIVIWVSID